MLRRFRVTLERAAAFVRRDHHDREFEAELSTHLEMSMAEYQRRGLSADEARRAALIALGGTQRTRDLHRDTRGLPRVETLMHDIRYAFRNIRRNRGFSATAILILALGIGATTLVFSVVNAVLLRPLPFTDPDRLVWIANDSPRSAAAGLSGVSSLVVVLEEWQRRATSFDALTGYNAFFGYSSAKLSGGGEPERVAGVEVAANFFDVIGIRPALGRTFSAEEASATGPDVLILSDGLWRRRFGGDPSIVGRQITFNDTATTVVGVMPPNFDFGAVFSPGVRVDVFQPLVFDEARNWGNTLAIVGRLEPGVAPAQANSELQALMPQILRDHPRFGTEHGARTTLLQNHVSGKIRPALLALAAAVGMVLLIVCANLSNLMLSRGAARQREFAIRAALGAGRGRLVRQMLTETLVLSSIGAALGFLAAGVAARALASVQSLAVPLLRNVSMDVTAGAFTAVVAFAAAMVAGLYPALQLARGQVNASLKDVGRGSTSARQGHVRNSLVVAEVALACVLLVAAGLLLRSFDRLLAVDLGFAPQQAVAIKVEANRTMTDAGARREFAAEALRRARALPGATAAGLTDTLPLDRDRAWGVGIPGRTFANNENPVAHVRMVSSGYFAAMGIRVRSGREFTDAEGLSTADILLVNETMARTLWPGRDAVGEEVLVGGRPLRIIGVASDVRHGALEKAAALEMYLPIGRFSIRSADLIVRSELPVEQLAASLRATLRPLDPSMPLAEVRPLQALVDRAVSPRRFYTTLLSSFAGAALVLACLGIFGVISYGVTRRTAEIGIRLALGATPASVSQTIVKETVVLAASGMALGLGASLVLAQGLSSLVYGVTTTDAATFGLTAAVLLMVSTAAAYLPARRAARVDPLIALRAE